MEDGVREAADGVTAANVERLRNERDAWKALAEARQELLACYRFGRKRSEALWSRMEAAVLELQRLGVAP